MPQEETQLNEVSGANNGRILLLEDDPHFMESYRERFKRSGFEVFTEDDEDEGMEMAVSCLPDAIILDISLPKDDDFGFLLEMKKYPQLVDTPVVILTDLNDDENRRKGLSLGAKDYLVRDELSFFDIAEKIRLIIEQRKK
jgi:DNA-binding response OmpR family regulator